MLDIYFVYTLCILITDYHGQHFTTLVYVQINLLLRHFTWEITLGSKKNYTVFLPSPTVRLNLILILSLAYMKWKQFCL